MPVLLLFDFWFHILGPWKLSLYLTKVKCLTDWKVSNSSRTCREMGTQSKPQPSALGRGEWQANAWIYDLLKTHEKKLPWKPMLEG